MKRYLLVFLITPLLFSQLFVHSQSVIDPTNCRDGENVEYCKTHIKMNLLKKKPCIFKDLSSRSRDFKTTRSPA